MFAVHIQKKNLKITFTIAFSNSVIKRTWCRKYPMPLHIWVWESLNFKYIFMTKEIGTIVQNLSLKTYMICHFHEVANHLYSLFLKNCLNTANYFSYSKYTMWLVQTLGNELGEIGKYNQIVFCYYLKYTIFFK